MTIAAKADVAVVGGGFSGAMVVVHLVEKADAPITVYWFDESASAGKGTAYSTQESAHLLNVPAGRMGAYPDRKEDFHRWLQTPEAQAAIDRICPDAAMDADGFLPRKLYGVYLETIVRRAVEEAQRKGITLQRLHGRVTDAESPDGVCIRLTHQGRDGVQAVDATAMVLATGNLPPQRFAFQSGMIQGRCGYVENVWRTPEGHVFPECVRELPADAETVIIGTGLTMVDAVLTLRERGYKGTITAISRHGLLPAAHAPAEPYPAWEWVENPSRAPRRAAALLAGLRQEVARAGVAGCDWRAVVDSLRPVTQELWKRLGNHERRRFLHKLFTFWNVHRHRMAPEIYAQLRSMQQNGSLKIISGKIYYVGADDDGLTVAFRRRGTNRVESIRSPLVLNCTGPTYDVAKSDHQLLKNMRDNELITVGPLRVGIETGSDGTAKGQLPGVIFPIGTLRVGELLECTAVPELREQAEQVAERVWRRVQQSSGPDTLAYMVI